MNLKEINMIFPTEEKCIDYLENIIWNGNPICPQCKSIRNTYVSKEKRYRCNKCNSSYNIKTGTLFNKTKIDLRKWLVLISLSENNQTSIRQLAKEIKVTKDTAWLMTDKIKHAFINQKELIQKIASKVHELKR